MAKQFIQDKKIAVFALGFRPFYLLASFWAIFTIFEWLLELQNIGIRSLDGMPGMIWHAHEMIFGFAATVITGFALTAVRAWTGLETPKAWKLMLLVALWFMARIGAFTNTALIVVDIFFLPIVAIIIGRLIIKVRMYRNLFLPLILIILGFLNALFYLTLLRYLNLDINQIIFAALYLIIMVEIMIGNRIIPSFTANASPGLIQNRNLFLTKITISGSALTFLLQIFSPVVLLNAGACFVIGALHLVLMWGWRPLSTRGKSLLWIMHLSYAWISAGFFLLGLSDLGVMNIYPALHVFGIGATGGLIIAMITRTALGHTGRALLAGPIESLCYLGIQATLFFWFLGNANLNALFYPFLVTAGVCWMSVFSLYLIKYFPLLIRPRPDGKAG
jgi:uncharacterized protein involved in response to NO